MLVALSVVFLALRKGLEMRRRRTGGRRRGRELLEAHVKLARPGVILVAIGLVSGPISAVWLRDWAPLGTLHGWLGLAAAALFIATGWLGRELAGGRSRAVDRHGVLGLVASLLAALAAVAGFVLLP